MSENKEKEMKKRPLEIFTGDNIRQMLLDNPDLPIAFLVTVDEFSGEYSNEFASSAHAEIGELLDCYQTVDECQVFTDRDEFEERLEDEIWYEAPSDFSDEDAKKWTEVELKKQLKEYEKYWKKCILVHVGN